MMLLIFLNGTVTSRQDGSFRVRGEDAREVGMTPLFQAASHARPYCPCQAMI